jgi:Zn-dependent protease
MKIYSKYQLTDFFSTSNIEIRDILKAWLAISIAFGIVLGGLTMKFFTAFIISAVAVGLGFLLHELSHKYFAQRYGLKAEFRSFDEMLFLAVIFALVFRFVIAALL